MGSATDGEGCGVWKPSSLKWWREVAMNIMELSIENGSVREDRETDAYMAGCIKGYREVLVVWKSIHLIDS